MSTPAIRERAVQLGPRGLVGVISETAIPNVADCPWLVVLNAGIAPRGGPGRLGVRLARCAAQCGLPALRFDHGGLGNSPGRWTPGAFHDQAFTELGEVLDALELHESARRFVLVGLCSGAATAWTRAAVDERVVAIALLNPRRLNSDPEWNAEALNVGWTRNYLARSLFRVDSWKRALSGRIQYRRLAAVMLGAFARKLTPSQRAAAVDEQLAEQLHRILERGVRVLLAVSKGDHALDQLARVLSHSDSFGALKDRVERIEVEGADHTFTVRANQTPLLAALERWLVDQSGTWSSTTTGGSKDHAEASGPLA